MMKRKDMFVVVVYAWSALIYSMMEVGPEQ